MASTNSENVDNIPESENAPDDRSDRFGHPEDGTDWKHYDENGKRIHGDFREWIREKARKMREEERRREGSS